MDGPSATFAARHRSRGLLACASLLALCAAAHAVDVCRPDIAPQLAWIAFVMPTMLVGLALYLCVLGSAAVHLLVEGRSLDGLEPGHDIVRVTLRRRWGLLPWTRPLVFHAKSVPSLIARWEERFFAKSCAEEGGKRRRQKSTSLMLLVGGLEIALPPVCGHHTSPGGGSATNNLAPEIRDALACYEARAKPLRRSLARAQIERRHPNKTAGGSSDVQGSSAPPPAFLVGSTENACTARMLLAVAAAVLVAAGLGLAAHFLPWSRLAFVCAASVLPLSASAAGLIATAGACGRTLHLQRTRPGLTALTVMADLWLLGPFRQRTHRLDPAFRFYVMGMVGEDEEKTFALVEAEGSQTLMVHRDELVVRRYGERLGGRWIDPAREAA